MAACRVTGVALLGVPEVCDLTALCVARTYGLRSPRRYRPQAPLAESLRAALGVSPRARTAIAVLRWSRAAVSCGRSTARRPTGSRPAVTAGRRLPGVEIPAMSERVAQVRGVLAERVVVSTQLDPFLALTALASYRTSPCASCATTSRIPRTRCPATGRGKILVRRSEFDAWLAPTGRSAGLTLTRSSPRCCGAQVASAC